MGTGVTVEHILSIKFSSLPLEKNIEIEKEGISITNLNTMQSTKTNSREFKRIFNRRLFKI